MLDPDSNNLATRPVALTLPLAGSHLIEASAGTGKTFTLALLFVRLLLERGLRADQILTVTFTKAATAELRQRIRRRLLDCRTALEGGPSDPWTSMLLEGDAELIRTRVDDAIAMFDSAPIYTIHAFAQRALAERAFSAGTSFELELGDTVDVWDQAVRDFWRSHVVHADPSRVASKATHRMFVEHALQKDTPDSWLKWLVSVRASVHAHLRPGIAYPLIGIETLDSAHRELAHAWHEQAASLEPFLINHPSLNGKMVARHNVLRWIAEVTAHLAAPPGLVHNSAAEKHLCSSKLADKRKSADLPVPEHPLIDLLDDYLKLQTDMANGFLAWRQDLLLRLYQSVPAQAARRLSEERRAGFDDLLQRLDALLEGEQGQRFAMALRERYPAALIDEFQDTDDLQDRIFATIYPSGGESVLVLVGDPKQAIYRFRGADIYTYLTAARRAEARHALRDNHRSSESLIGALNTLYRGSPRPFVHEEIAYLAVTAAHKERSRLSDEAHDESSALHFIVPDGVEDGATDAETLARNAAATVAGEIASMLMRAASGKLRLGARALVAGDIAVLVKSNEQGTMIRRALRRVGVGAADRSRGSVYASEECEWLLLTLTAALESHRSDRIMNALATPLFGFDAESLSALLDDESQWRMQLDAFDTYRTAWQQGGVMRLLRALLVSSEGAKRLSASASGERHLTNLFHLCELMHEENDISFGLHMQIAWLNKKHQADFDENEEGELRLESDENLVQVMTVHKSKGLEFPVVFVPFMFTGREPRQARAARLGDMPVAYHDPAHDERLVLDFGSIDYGVAMRRAAEESAAEDARVLYVALTRASHRCVVFWDESAHGARAALTQLIFTDARSGGLAGIEAGSNIDAGPKMDVDAEVDAGVTKMDRNALRQRLRVLEQESQGSLRMISIGEGQTPLRRSQAGSPTLHVRTFGKRPIEPWRLASFTSLMRRLSAPELVDRPDHDQTAQADADSEPAPSPLLRFSFTRGASAGECLHDMFERVSFAELGTSRGAIGALLAKHGMDAREAPGVSKWLDEVARAPLGRGGFCLAEIAPAAQIREMDFHLPLTHALIRDLAPVAARHGFVVPRFMDGTIDGFLKGFIDLVVLHGGRYYVIDYKSNWLGGSFADYRKARLDRAMQEGGYHLQYLLYCVALVRWLRWRDPEFDFDRQFGGVYYLFIRGMGGPGDMALPQDGIYAAQPTRELIEELDTLLSGGAR